MPETKINPKHWDNHVPGLQHREKSRLGNKKEIRAIEDEEAIPAAAVNSSVVCQHHQGALASKHHYKICFCIWF